MTQHAVRDTLARLWRGNDGATIIEIAILLPTFLLFLLGICEFGRVLFTQASLQYAVEAAARCSVINASGTCNSTAATKTYAAGEAFGLSIPTSTFTVSGGCSGTMTITASYSFAFIVPQLFPWTPTLTAKSAFPC